MDVLSNSDTSDYLTTRYAIAGTFALYVRLVWHSRMSMVKTLFFINRYLPFCFTVLAAHIMSKALYFPYTTICNRNIMISGSCIESVHYMGKIEEDTFLFISTDSGRLCTLPEANLNFIKSFWHLVKAGIAGGYYGTVRYIRAASVSKINAFVVGCVVRTDNRMSEAISYGLILLYEAFVLALMLYKLYRHRVVTSALMRIAYGDSVFYCSFILLITISNVVLLAVGSEILCHLLLLPQAALHNILCNRLLLRLRSANTSLSEEGFLSIHVSGRLDSLIPLSDLDSEDDTVTSRT
ncbi:hypothetical protein A7U60_g7368 [Sanghuangporus baumii]|uniref:DUF6533 domain-containing protein n=1 Tax=Sanghuangporus baumii TaxID=108892 RepID=A0A9Q5HTU3_SANBA|nr:hypothetical protein A7U60_g7368 [Sanghuangporus baumii]